MVGMSQEAWRRVARAGVLALAGLSLAACAGMRTEISKERSLLEADRAFAKMSLDQGAPAAMRAMLSPAGSMLSRPEGEYIGPDQAARAFPAPGAGGDSDVLYWDPDKAWISADDTLGVTTGRFVRTIDGVQQEQGRYVTIWRRTSSVSGLSWKAELSMINTDAPITPPQTAPPAPTPPTAPAPAPAPRRRP
jgi:hypothetical protein